MQIQVYSRVHPTGVDFHDTLAARLERSLQRMRHGIRRVVLRVDDLNGPKGGVDRACRIEAELVHGGTVRAQARAEHLLAALDRAMQRVVRQLREAARPRRARRISLRPTS